MELYPWQSDFLGCREPICAWIAPRQSGKTTAVLLKANQVDACVIIAPHETHLHVLRQRQELLEREGFNSYPQLISANGSHHISEFPDLIIIEEATTMTMAQLTFYLQTARNYHSQLVFMGTPHQNNRNLPDLCVQENIPVHRTRQSPHHQDAWLMSSLRRSLTDSQYMNQALGMYEPEIERLFTRPGLKEFDLCELISLPPTP